MGFMFYLPVDFRIKARICSNQKVFMSPKIFTNGLFKDSILFESMNLKDMRFFRQLVGKKKTAQGPVFRLYKVKFGG